ncbi:MAG: CARDB domain-containing protein [Candidatus Thalassarchaeaceae archaeon]
MRAASIASMAVFILAFAQISHSISPDDLHFSDSNPIESKVQAMTTTGTADVPIWRVNDNWMYDGFLDVGDFVADSGVSTNVETLDGSLDRTVEDIFLMEIDGEETLVYEVESVGEYESDGVIQIDGTSGCLYVDMQTTEIIRVSDLATYSQEVTVDVYFDPLFFGCASWLRQDIGELVVENTYEPPLENYDFPISVGESWAMDYEQATDYSGSSNYVDIPDDSSDSNSTSWAVVSQGNSGVAYPGCYQSFNVTAYDSDGEETGFNWYCPAVRGEVKSTMEQAFGFLAVHELVSYQPVQRGKLVSIDVQYPLSPTDIEISAWINVTDQGQGVSGQEIQFRYESDQQFQNVTTDENGSYHIVFNTGSNPDDTDGPGELGSHGIIAWISNERIIGGRTLMIDSEIHEIDLVTRSSAVTVQRFRPSTGNQLTLDSSIGFAAISGDVLTFSVPVFNRGLIQSPNSTIVVSAPDGGEVFGTVPPLGSLQESRVSVNWTVPESQQFGNVYLFFEVDPQEEISEDGNRTNNQGSFVLYIGGLPLAFLSHSSEVQTHEIVTLDASSSYDSDGGYIECEFHIQKIDGSTFQETDEDCILEWSWPDDGTFPIEVLITDGESDAISAQSTISVVNRPPEISIGTDNDEVVVTNQITFFVTNSSDIDTLNPSAPVEILWNAGCSEGQVGQSCTLTPIVEGNLTVSVMATDDDGAITMAQHSVHVTNIAPSNPVAELYLGETRIFPDSRGVFTVLEGDEVTFWGQADDSSNDIESLKHVWKPYAEDIPELNFSSFGERSTLSGITYNTSGMHLATLQVFDDDGESTEVLIVPIQVENVAPEISPITTTLGELEEDEDFTILPQVIETGTDSERLVQCFDLDPEDDSNSDGQPGNDCDVESPFLAYSWPDSTSAPDSLIFHVTDDDGESASIEFSFSVVNTPPAAYASASVSNPTEGDSIVLSANGTVDSQADMDSLDFHWDIDITHDSDGDGDPANDVDYTGRWIEFSYDSGGSKKAQLTVFDDSSSHSVTMDLEVAEASETFSEALVSNIAPIIFTLVAVSIGAWVLIRNPGQSRSEEEKKASDIDFDAAFDEPEPPVVDPNEMFAPSGDSSLEDAAILDGLDEVLDELGLGGGDASEIPSAPIIDEANSNLDLEDIEALFEE